VLTPSCWETYPGFENYRGRALYETDFTLPDDASGRGNCRLEFKGVSHGAKVYIDDALAGTHYGSYTPFTVLLKNAAPGLHRLKVEADNSYGAEYPLDIPNDYYSYGGLSRPVLMEQIPDISLDAVHITPLFEQNHWRAKVAVFCSNLSDAVKTVSLSLSLQGTNTRFENIDSRPGKHKIIEALIDCPVVQAWSPENPQLYTLETLLFVDGIAADDLIERIGFRTLSVEGSRIVLNGEALYIKGFCRHEDHPQYGCALPLEAMAADLRLIKDLGGNSLRTSHYPNDERFLDLCDELGILVWEENHARGLSEEVMRNPLFEGACEQVISEMIYAHYNHPSIYIWGILNECASDTAYGRDCYAKQFALIRSLDAGRPCSFASCQFLRCLCQDLPDVLSWNIYPYWYEDKTAADKLDETWRYAQAHNGGMGDKPFLVTEIGAGALYGFRSPAAEKWSEEYQAEALRKQLTEVMADERCSGVYIWQFCDVRVSREWFKIRPRCHNNKGVVDEYRRPKLAYQTVKELFKRFA
jgi:beta-glucuronidase